MTEDKEFLSRWSKRKLAVEQETADTAAPVVEDTPKPLEVKQEQLARLEEGDSELDTDEIEPGDAEPHPAEGIDIEELKYDSDFTVFMNEKVPETVRRMALRKLWRSNPILANLDGMNDYDEDYTDAAAVLINSVGKVLSGTRDKIWDDEKIAEVEGKVAESNSDQDDLNNKDEPEVEEIDDLDDLDVEDMDDFDELEIADNIEADAGEKTEENEIDKKPV